MLIWVRNRFAHLAVLENQDIDLTRELNFARALMSYDRKLKNAVAQSIAEMLQRNKLKMRWQMGKEENAKDPADKYVKIAYDKIKAKNGHYLFGAKAESCPIYHLGQENNKNLKKFFEEKLQSGEFISMVQMLFGGSKIQKSNAPTQINPQQRPNPHNGKKTGTVESFNAEKRMGFITPDGGGAKIFVHISAVRAAGLQSLKIRQRLCFDIEPQPGKDPKAVNLELL